MSDVDWEATYESLSADRETLGAAALERLATAAFLTGRDDAYVPAWECAYRAQLTAGDTPGAARSTWWIGDYLHFRGEAALATGWFARGRRLLERVSGDCAARGFLLLPLVQAHVAAGDHGAAAAAAARAGEIGERLSERDLIALALMEHGHALFRQGRLDEGLRLVDETLVIATTEPLSPVIAGTVFCTSIAFCRDAFELGRARAWTEAHTQWCARQPGMVGYMGTCLVHRAEIMALAGKWAEALAEVRRAGRFQRGVLNERVAGQAAYLRGEVHLLQGELRRAKASFREASRRGREPQPGLALLRLAQGESAAAAASLRRALGEEPDPLRRAALLPAFVEISLAAGELAAAREACRELAAVAEVQGSLALTGLSEYSRGAVALAGGDPRGALAALRRACDAWQELEAPREIARTRELVGEACAALGDRDTAALEREAAADTLARLCGNDRPAHGLTARELEILRLVAGGRSNREIAASLVISDHTVRRHVQNTFAKLGVSSRAAATAFAYRHDLV